MKIAVIGGTGKEGRGLVLRLAASGADEVFIGSRQAEKAQAKAEALNQQLGRRAVVGLENRAAAHAADLAILCVPYAAHEETLRTIAPELQGKILVDTTVPLDPHDPLRLRRRSEQSAAEEAQRLLGDAVRVVAAFQNVSAAALQNLERAVECDILVCGDDMAAKEAVIALIRRLGLRAWDAGSLRMARAVEEITPLLISLNRRYGSRSAGIRITGLEETTSSS
ncbi:MAG: NADPH-dependent F420 reductase [Blastocatellia bacterium]|nr:NADPH-dependent F420 reductase [Blastocatellia bacterium]MCS7158461.1 NADPH-dependent F420 reductase [Blastocatellia bacterium]MCX7753467.1 NADPH-dependent F420 reductase [Blastocatellia bacterium]MDW8167858.1 NADPH-dependent F420 reductase [Acidobacteriota bacterium]MDW8255892.1 NADPH-dependent F420 reductase [Acidobacteriota bacterium]